MFFAQQATSLGTRLFADIHQFRTKPAIVDMDGHVTEHGRLAELGSQLVAPLGSDRKLVAIECSNNLLPIAAFVGCLRAGHVVLLTKEGDRHKDDRIIRRFAPHFIFEQNAGDWRFESLSTVPIALHPELAVLLSSSGSTGDPKLIRLSHANLLSNAHAIAEYLELDSGERAITTLPFHYSYGLSVINSHLMIGAAVVLDDGSVTDSAFWERFEANGATSFAGVPHSFDLLERTPFMTAPPASLRYFTVAGGKLAPDKVTRFADLAERTGKRFYVMYGQTEASPRIAYVPPSLVASHPGTIGRAIPGGSLTLLDTDGCDIEEAGVIGELVYRGPNVMMGYATESRDLSLGNVADALHTGDLASRDERGLFTIAGRKSRFIKLFGLRINLDDVEQFLAGRALEVAAVGDDDTLIVALAGAADEKVTQAIVTQYGLTASVVHVVHYSDALPRLASGKVDYGTILRSGKPQPEVDRTVPASTGIAAGLANLLGTPTLDPARSFADLGGDSLNFIAASMLLEDRLGYCPPGWERLPLNELEAMAPASAVPSMPAAKRPGVAPDVLARCACILLIVFHHGAAVPIDGAASALLMIAGFNFGRFQHSRVASVGPWRAITSLLVKIVPIYYMLMLIYFGLKQDWYWPNFLLFANFTRGYDDGNTVIGLYWFIEVYIYLVVAGSLLIALPVIRRFAEQRAFSFGMLLIASGAVLHVLTMPHHHVPTAQQHSPILLFYVFALGWAITFSSTAWEKMLLSVVGLLMLGIFPAHNTVAGFYVNLPVFLLLTWTTRIEFSSGPAVRLINMVAQSSLYIYLIHPAVFMPLLAMFGHERIAGIRLSVLGALALTIPLSVIAGLFLHRLVNFVTGRMGTNSKATNAELSEVVTYNNVR